MKRRGLSALLAAVVMMAVLPAAVFANGGQDTGAKKMTTLKVLAWDRGTVPSEEGSITDNWFVDWTNQQVADMGIQVEIVPLPRNKEAEMLPMLLAAQNAPDLCNSYDKTMIVQFAMDGGLVDFTELVSPEITPNILDYYSDADLEAGQINGQQFMFRNMNTGETAQLCSWVRQDWLDALGMDQPTTLDEFYDVLVAFKEQDPGHVGEDIVPWAMNSSYVFWYYNVMAAFVADEPVGEDMAVPAPLWPEAKETLRFMNKCFNEGLLGNYILDTDKSLYKQAIVLGQVGSFTDVPHWPFHPAYGELYKNLKNNVPAAELSPITPFQKASDEDWVTLFRGNKYSGYIGFGPIGDIDPELQARLFDFMHSSEYRTAVSYGFEGEHYNLEQNDVVGKNIPVKINPISAEKIDWIQPQYMAFSRPFWASDDTTEPFWNWDFGDLQPKWLEAIEMTKIKDHPWGIPEINAPMPMASKYKSQLDSIWKNALPKILVADPADFDKIFNESVAEYRSNGGDEVEKEARELFREIYGEGDARITF